MSQRKKKKTQVIPEVEHLDLDESIWIVVDFPNEVHVLPETDVIDHDCEWQCWCNPKQINREQTEMQSERPVYAHNRCMDVVQ
jgi:hypothetical protein